MAKKSIRMEQLMKVTFMNQWDMVKEKSPTATEPTMKESSTRISSKAMVSFNLRTLIMKASGIWTKCMDMESSIGIKEIYDILDSIDMDIDTA